MSSREELRMHRRQAKARESFEELLRGERQDFDRRRDSKRATRAIAVIVVAVAAVGLALVWADHRPDVGAAGSVTAPGTGATPGSLAGAVVTRLSPADVTCPSRAAFRLARLGGGSDFGYLGLPADGSHLVAQITVRFPPSTIVVSLCADRTGHLWYFSHDSQSADTGLVTPATLVPDGAGFSAHFDFAAPGGTVPAAYLVEADGVAVTSGVPPAAKTTLLGVVRVECVDRSALRLTWPALGAPVCAAADTLGWHPSLR